MLSSLSFKPTILVRALAPLFPLLMAASAYGQTPAGIMERKQASDGATEVAVEGFQAPKKESAPEDTTELSVSGGALMAGGNSRSAAATGVLRFMVRRAESQLSAAAAANYAQSAVRGEKMEPTVENYQGNVRYDYFLSQNVSVFASMTGRRDQFQGLDLRLNVGPGVAYFIFREQDVQLWTELGYDFQHDLRSRDAVQAAADEGTPIPSEEARHNGRFFAGYSHRLNDKLRFDTGVEFIRQLFVPAHMTPPDRSNWRLNYNSAITTEIIRRLSFATSVTALYDNNPLPNVARLDVMTSVNLVYSLL